MVVNSSLNMSLLMDAEGTVFPPWAISTMQLKTSISIDPITSALVLQTAGSKSVMLDFKSVGFVSLTSVEELRWMLVMDERNNYFVFNLKLKIPRSGHSSYSLNTVTKRVERTRREVVVHFSLAGMRSVVRMKLHTKSGSNPKIDIGLGTNAKWAGVQVEYYEIEVVHLAHLTSYALARTLWTLDFPLIMFWFYISPAFDPPVVTSPALWPLSLIFQPRLGYVSVHAHCMHTSGPSLCKNVGSPQEVYISHIIHRIRESPFAHLQLTFQLGENDVIYFIIAHLISSRIGLVL